ncbi:hypothetical protein Hanom_Chr09g00822811 [Helianthus anomalus]
MIYFTYFVYFKVTSSLRKRLTVHHVVASIAERQKGTCTNRLLSRLLSVMCPKA